MKSDTSKMKVEDFTQVTSWKRVLKAARATVHKNDIDKIPSDKFKRKMLIAEHSPIRLLEFEWDWKYMQQWITVHFVRHHVGCEKFVGTQRIDRTSLKVDNRDELPQGEYNEMMMCANAQALINISRKRLCSDASTETRHAWKLVMEELKKVDPIMEASCVRECIYRGFCTSFNGCGYDKTEAFQKELTEYRNQIK